MHEEILDLVDVNDTVIDTITRTEADNTLEAERKGYLRASDLYLVNDAGELWVPKRTAHKKVFPNGLDFSVGGHVESGEDYLTTILRESEEEINLRLDPDALKLVDIQRFDEILYFDALYIYRTNSAPQFNPDDFVSAEWLLPQALLEKLDSGVPAKRNIRPAVECIVASQVYKDIIAK